MSRRPSAKCHGIFWVASGSPATRSTPIAFDLSPLCALVLSAEQGQSTRPIQYVKLFLPRSCMRPGRAATIPTTEVELAVTASQASSAPLSARAASDDRSTWCRLLLQRFAPKGAHAVTTARRFERDASALSRPADEARYPVRNRPFADRLVYYVRNIELTCFVHGSSFGQG
jgi:hypothetical protein